MHARLSFSLRLASVAVTALLLAGPSARAQQAAPLTGPYFNYTAMPNVSDSSQELVTLTLTGFTNDPSANFPGSPEYANHSVWSFYEKTFEQAGGIVTGGLDISNDGPPWTFHQDVGFSTPVRPVVPQDPRTFVLTTLSRNPNLHLYNQIFYFYNYDNESGNLFVNEPPPPLGGIVNGQLIDPTKNRGPIAFGVPCPVGQVCGGTIRQPAANVPEPGALLTLSVGMTLGAGALARRRRRV